MAVYDAYGAQQFYFPNVLKYDPDQLRQELAAPGGVDLVNGVAKQNDVDTLNKRTDVYALDWPPESPDNQYHLNK